MSGDMATVQPRLGPGHRIVTTPAFGVRVDPDKCQGLSRCYAIAPELFVMDDWASPPIPGSASCPRT